MAIKSISQIIIKKGSINYLPDSLAEGEMCFTTDTGEIFIGAPNFGPVQYRTSETGGENKLPYRNIKLLTEFDAVKSITGDIYFQGPLLNVQFPITEDAVDLYTFTEGNTIIVSYSLYDGINVNVVGDLYISVNNNKVMVCKTGQKAKGIIFSGYLNSNGQIVLQGINTTNSIYTLYINAKCWDSDLAKWDGTKGSGVNSTCAGDGTLDDNYLSELQDVKLTNLSDKQFLQYNYTDKMWENATISYSDISGEIPEGKSRISELLDVKLTNLTDKQFLQYNSTDKMWDNVSLNYSDISGTPPEGPENLKDLLDVKLTNLTDTQILQYSGTDQKWENVNLPPTPASWTVSTVSASGSTISDATKCTTSLINVSSSDGYSQGVASISFSNSLAKDDYVTGYVIEDVAYDETTANNPSLDTDHFYGYNPPYYPVTTTGSGSDFAILYKSSIFRPASYLGSVEIKLSAVSTKPVVGDLINAIFLYDDNANNGEPTKTYFCEFVVESVGTTSFTITYNFKSTFLKPHKDGTTSPEDILSLSKGDIVYTCPWYELDNPTDTLGGLQSPFTNWGTYGLGVFNPFFYSPKISGGSVTYRSTLYAEDSGKYSFTLTNNVVSCKQYTILNLVTDNTSGIYISAPGKNYNVNDIVTFYKTYNYKITSITSVPTRGIVLPDSQTSTGSMVIVKNNTNNKPINVYSTISNSLVSTIPDSSYMNYETKFIKTSSGWTKF